ncbi:MAG: tyrosine-type recombinase/integrase [Rhizobiaceae bacterium]
MKNRGNVVPLLVGQVHSGDAAANRTELEEIYDSLDNEDLRLLVQSAALTGMRIEEIMSSEFSAATQSIVIGNSKTEAGVRTIPLHSALNAEAIAKMQGKYRPVGEEGKRSDAIGKQINRRLVGLGYKGREKTFHSIRKYVATCFENSGVDELKASRILGHNLKTMSYGLYSGGQDLEALRGTIEQLKPL